MFKHNIFNMLVKIKICEKILFRLNQIAQMKQLQCWEKKKTIRKTIETKHAQSCAT